MQVNPWVCIYSLVNDHIAGWNIPPVHVSAEVKFTKGQTSSSWPLVEGEVSRSRICKGDTGMSGVMLEGFLLKKVIELEKTSEIILGDAFQIQYMLF